MAGKGQNKMLKQLAKKALEDAKENALVRFFHLVDLLLIDVHFSMAISSIWI